MAKQVHCMGDFWSSQCLAQKCINNAVIFVGINWGTTQAMKLMLFLGEWDEPEQLEYFVR